MFRLLEFKICCVKKEEEEEKWENIVNITVRSFLVNNSTHAIPIHLLAWHTPSLHQLHVVINKLRHLNAVDSALSMVLKFSLETGADSAIIAFDCANPLRKQ